MEIVKNFSVGALFLGLIFAVMGATKYAAMAFGVPEEDTGFFIFAPLLVYLTYVFGGLTRAIYFNKS